MRDGMQGSTNITPLLESHITAKEHTNNQVKNFDCIKQNDPYLSMKEIGARHIECEMPCND